MNKRQTQIFESWVESNVTDLEMVYRTFSLSKYWAFKACLAWKDTINGYCGKIISFNKFMFTYGFLSEDSQNHLYFNYMTPTKKERWLVTKGEH